MREILCRGKSETTLEWVIGYYFKTYCKTGIQERGHFKYINVIPETVGQYTGRNIGEDEIFDGDILENSTDIYVVCWHEEYLLWGTKNKKGADCYSLRTLLSDTKRPCKKIGNIHDNPELL